MGRIRYKPVILHKLVASPLGVEVPLFRVLARAKKRAEIVRAFAVFGGAGGN